MKEGQQRSNCAEDRGLLGFVLGLGCVLRLVVVLCFLIVQVRSD